MNFNRSEIPVHSYTRRTTGSTSGAPSCATLCSRSHYLARSSPASASSSSSIIVPCEMCVSKGDDSTNPSPWLSVSARCRMSRSSAACLRRSRCFGPSHQLTALSSTANLGMHILSRLCAMPLAMPHCKGQSHHLLDADNIKPAPYWSVPTAGYHYGSRKGHPYSRRWCNARASRFHVSTCSAIIVALHSSFSAASRFPDFDIPVIC